MIEQTEPQTKVLKYLYLIQELEKDNLAEYPTFRAFIDGGDGIDLGERTNLSHETILAVLKFCKKHSLHMAINSSKNDNRITDGWMQISLYPNHEEDVLENTSHEGGKNSE
jgi:hypothetical protein